MVYSGHNTLTLDQKRAQTETPLMDTQQQQDIAFNLAKLKEDLKNQAEAIQDLRKQAWENTGTSYMS